MTCLFYNDHGYSDGRIDTFLSIFFVDIGGGGYCHRYIHKTGHGFEKHAHRRPTLCIELWELYIYSLIFYDCSVQAS